MRLIAETTSAARELKPFPLLLPRDYTMILAYIILHLCQGVFLPWKFTGSRLNVSCPYPLPTNMPALASVPELHQQATTPDMECCKMTLHSGTGSDVTYAGISPTYTNIGAKLIHKIILSVSPLLRIALIVNYDK